MCVGRRAPHARARVRREPFHQLEYLCLSHTLVHASAQAIDRMVLAAEERRHGGVVAYLSEALSYAQLYRRVPPEGN